MHRRAAGQSRSAAAWGRAVIGALAGLQTVVLIVGVFLFALAMTSLDLEGRPHRTVNLHLTQDTSAVGH